MNARETMRALRVDNGSLRLVTDQKKPIPKMGDILVRVLRAGICDTDIQIKKGYMQFAGTLGHEFVGIAEGGKHEGKRVVGEINCCCARCDACLSGLGNHCPHRTVLGILNRDGAFADYVLLPDRNLHPIPDEIEDDEAVFVEPLAAAFQIPRQVPLDKRSRILVLGDGKLGNLVAQVLKAHDCQVTVAGKHQHKLRAIERFGIGTEIIGDMRRSRTFGLVVDCTGSNSGFADALQFVRPRGTIVLKTTVADQTELNLAPVVIDEIAVVGSRCGPFGPAIEAIQSKTIEVKSLIHDHFSLEQGVNAFELAERSGSTKVLLDIAGR